MNNVKSGTSNSPLLVKYFCDHRAGRRYVVYERSLHSLLGQGAAQPSYVRVQVRG